jgi:Holliday junction resolvasome RuvABC DNA-binding subunit
MVKSKRALVRELITALQSDDENLLAELQDDDDEKSTKKILMEVRDELRVQNSNTSEDRKAREQAEKDEELAKLFPALRSRGYGNKLTFRNGSPLLGEGPPNTKDSPPGYGS